MKKYLIAIATGLVIAGSLTAALVRADTIGTISQWIYDTANNIISPRVTNTGVKVPSLASSNNCVVTDTNGKFSTATCGTGGSGATTTIVSNITSNGPNFTFASGTTPGLNFNISGSGSTLTFAPHLQGGYIIPTTTLMTNLETFYTTPSTRIWDGLNLTWGNYTTLGNPGPLPTLDADLQNHLGQGYKSPTTASSTGTNPWTNPNNIFSVDGSASTNTVDTGSTTGFLAATGFGFSIPTDAQILGIQAEWYKQKVGTGCTMADAGVFLLKANLQVGSDKSQGCWAGSYVYSTYGSQTDLWGSSWTPADINNAGFGVELAAHETSGNSYDLSIDHVRMLVYYKEANQTITVSGVVSGSGTSTIATSFASTTPIAYGGTGTSTVPVNNGQLLMASGANWMVGQLDAGTNITISTSTAGHISITASGGSATPGGFNTQVQYNNSGALAGVELFYNNSNITLGVNSTTPNASLVIQGTSTQPTLPVLIVASSSNASLFQVKANGDVLDAELTSGKCVQAGANGLLTSAAAACGSGTINLAGGQNITVDTSTALTIVSLSGTVGTGNGGTGITTAPVNNGQLLMGSGTAWALGQLDAGANITITTSTANHISIATTGLAPTSRLINTTAPLKGGGDLSADRTFFMDQASTTGSGYLAVADWQTFNNKVNGSGAVNQVTYWTAASTTAGNANFLWLNTPKELLINTSTLDATFGIVASSTAQVAPLLRVASSSGVSFFQISATGNLSMSTFTANTLLQADGGKNVQSTALVGGTNIAVTTSTPQLISVGITGTIGTGNGGTGINSAPVNNGQLLMGSGTSWVIGQLDAGTNITIATSTSGHISITAAGNGGTVSGASPQIAYFSGATTVNGSNNFEWLNTAQEHLINTTTLDATLGIVASSTAQVAPLFRIASSAGVSLFQVSVTGNTSIATLTANTLIQADGGKNLQSTALVGGTNISITTSTPQLIVAAISGTIGTGNGGTGLNTAPVNNGQLLMGNGTAWTIGQLDAGSNITITTSTAGHISIAATGGGTPGTPVNSVQFNLASAFTGSANFEWLNTAQELQINTSTLDASFGIQASSTSQTAPIFRIASSSGQSLVTVFPTGNIGIGSVTPSSLFAIQGSTNRPLSNLFTIASSTAVTNFQIDSNGLFTLQPSATSTTAFLFNDPSGNPIITINNTSVRTSPTTQALVVASTTGASMFQVNYLGQGYFGYNLNVGTTTQLATLAVEGTSTSPTLDIFRVASSSGATIMKIDAKGHQVYATLGATASVSTCGTSPLLNGNDVEGDILLGTGSPSACTLTFAAPYKNVVCVAVDSSSTINADVSATSTTSVTFTLSGALSSGHIYYHCFDNIPPN